MMNMKIAVGTTSSHKIQYLQEVLDELQIVADLMPFEVESGVSEQPISAEETRTGSINRTKHALSKCENPDIALGIEVGYHPNADGDYEILCWATLINKNGEQISMESHRLLLPSFHQNILKQNKYLGEYVRQFLAENPDQYSQLIGEDIRSRKPFIKASLKSVLDEYFG